MQPFSCGFFSRTRIHTRKCKDIKYLSILCLTFFFILKRKVIKHYVMKYTCMYTTKNLPIVCVHVYVHSNFNPRVQCKYYIYVYILIHTDIFHNKMKIVTIKTFVIIPVH